MAKRILVIEDEAAIRDLICMNLEVAGYETAAFGDGIEVSEALKKEHKYDCALLDMQRFRDAVQTKKMTGENDSRVKESVLAYQFRSIFGSDGALFLDGEEQYNRTPYTYDIKNLRNMQSQEDYYFNLSVSNVQTVHGKRLLLFYSEKSGFMQVGKKCEVVVYRSA